MNALLVLFFAAIFITDYLFKEGVLIKIYAYLFFGYLIIAILTRKSQLHSTFKNILIAMFSQSVDPTIYGKIKVSTLKLKAFLEEYNTKNNVKVTWTLLMTKILANSIRENSQVNTAIKCGKLMDRGPVDMSVLVNVEGKVSSIIVIIN